MSEEFLIGRPSRRQLFRGGLAVAAGPLLGGVPSAFGQTDAAMATRAIPHSGERIPVIGLGTANEFQVRPEADARANLKKVVDDLLAQGCKLIDTASSYGSAESVLGESVVGPGSLEGVSRHQDRERQQAGRLGRIPAFAAASALSAGRSVATA